MKQICYLALGSNLGDRHTLLRECRAWIVKKIGREVAASSLYETAPVGYQSTNLFLNMVVAVETELQPEEVLRVSQEIERTLGRERKSNKGVHYDRTCDIDIILFGDMVLESHKLQIPHPRFRERAFVLEPLCEVAPDLVDPVTGKTIKELAERYG